MTKLRSNELNNVAGNIMIELNEAELSNIAGAGTQTRGSNGSICTLTIECDHLRTLTCCN